MTPELAYFLKVNMAFALFYAFYRLFFYKDTFFLLRRFILLLFFILALVYPLFNIQDWIAGQEPIAGVIEIYSAMMLPEVNAYADLIALFDWKAMILDGGVYLYFGLLGLLCLRFFTQMGSILWLARTSEIAYLNHLRVHLLSKPASPFSFFRLIFIHPQSHSREETDEILAHEQTHVSQWHSIDVIISEIICMLCWFNPFVWLLKREVRHNLEYLADLRVLESGYDSKTYQYHLLGLAHQDYRGTSIYNSFNIIHLKNRIIMMNKKRSSSFARAKYLMFIPLVVVLMILSNIEAVARVTKGVARDLISESHALTDNSATDPVYNFEEITVTAIENQTDTVPKYYKVVDQMPSFPGGDQALLQFLAKSIKYPEEAIKKKIEGRVIIAFIVDEKGNITNLTVEKSVDPLLDAEAKRVVSIMPTWEPGRHNGKVVPVRYLVPVTFRLGPNSPSTKATTSLYDYPGYLGLSPEMLKTLTVVEHMPEFPGGQEEFLKFIANSVKYPMESQHAGIQGKVICTFIINKDGTITEAEVVESVDPLLDQEAVRVINLMPAWKPGRNEKNEPVRVKYAVPITFRLS